METTEVLIKTAPTQSATPAQEGDWTEVIQPQTQLLDLGLANVWRYRDLVVLFVRRDFVSNYKQTILGPLWLFIQPLLTTITFYIVFGRVANLSTNGIPQFIFYLAGNTVWGYFSQSLTAVATVFTTNAAMLSKVYFPRLALPLSIVISNLVRFSIQFGLFLLVWVFYLFTSSAIHPSWVALLTPLLVMLMGMLSLGLGMIFTALTTKYRDLAMLLTFGVQLALYATPVIYPLSTVPAKYHWLILANPMSAIVETFRVGFLGPGTFNWLYLGYSTLATLVVLLAGTVIFNKVEKSFTDTV
ncbi:ABC transporter permease [Hymenobacter polaris]|uniref:ABC transporter permease n=1 Tax=Hymenobacter polaris TaxID=2682546 RepID=UPI00293B9A2B|nr:ABC transporter permease [Hymenobacter polaris]